jgi:hypothetical protein
MPNLALELRFIEMWCRKIRFVKIFKNCTRIFILTRQKCKYITKLAIFAARFVFTYLEQIN